MVLPAKSGNDAAYKAPGFAVTLGAALPERLTARLAAGARLEVDCQASQAVVVIATKPAPPKIMVLLFILRIIAPLVFSIHQSQWGFRHA
jgi:hypothetical protein